MRERVRRALSELSEATILGDGALVDRPVDNSLGCVVLGTELANRATLDLVDSLRSTLKGPRVVLVCRRTKSGEVRRALAHGVDGVVLDDHIDQALPAVIRAVCAGQICVPEDRRGDIGAPALTNREKQILGLVVMGLTNGQIAAKLFLAESTVKSHLSSAFSKLDVSSRNEAVNVILDPERGVGLGILRIPAERITAPS